MTDLRSQASRFQDQVIQAHQGKAPLARPTAKVNHPFYRAGRDVISIHPNVAKGYNQVEGLTHSCELNLPHLQWGDDVMRIQELIGYGSEYGMNWTEGDWTLPLHHELDGGQPDAGIINYMKTNKESTSSRAWATESSASSRTPTLTI